MFYRGYVRTKDKKCIERFGRNAKLHTLEEVADLDEYAGILASDSILIDVDDMEQSEKLLSIVEDMELSCRVYKSRSGMHFLFKNDSVNKCYTAVNLACGIIADIKSGLKNSYEVLKIDGKEREIVYDTGEYQLIPKYLTPVKTNVVFSELGEGDGRNQKLFEYILKLQSEGFSIDEARQAIRLINKYVLAVPLDESEVDTILRDEAFAKPIFFEKNRFLFERFAQYMRSQHHVKRINNQLHLYDNGIYISGQAEIEAKMIEHIPELNKSKRSEVLAYLDILIRENSAVSPPNFIAFRNGIYDIKTDELKPYSPDLIVTNKVPWDYNPNAECESVDSVLNNISCNDTDIRALLEEMVGYTMYRRNELGKAFILTGSGKNGKSTFLTMIKRMLGTHNISVLDMKKLGDRFSTVMLFGKLANIGDDISDEFLADASEFKKICTGEMIDAEQKGQPKFQFVATLDEYGCERWEAMLKIIIKPTDDLPLRRFRILSKLLSDLPYTERALRNVLTNLCGEKWYSLDIRHNDYYIMIWIEVEQMEQQQIVIDTVKRMIPANLILDVQINFRSHGWIKEHALTHGALHKYSHKGIRTIVL